MPSKNLGRREVLVVLGAGLGAALAGCSNSPTSPDGTATGGAASGGTSSAACAVIPSETEGPYPDVTGMISNPAFFRRDVTEGKPGVPLTLTLTLLVTVRPLWSLMVACKV